MGRCFVIQPFDGDAFDKRYDDVLAPAIRDAGLEPYRVDRDPTVAIPIDSIESGIRSADACVADISTDNPNVWYELGYANAAGKDVVLICSRERTRFPFDVQHRNVVRYASDSSRDFAELASRITARLKAVIKKQVELQAVSSLSPLEETEGLSPHEVAVLVVIMQNRWSPESSLSPRQIIREVGSAGYKDLAATLGLESLRRKGFVQVQTGEDQNGEPLTEYEITPRGIEWLLQNEERLILRSDPDGPAF